MMMKVIGKLIHPNKTSEIKRCVPVIVYGNKGRYYSGPKIKIQTRWDCSVFLPIFRYVYIVGGLTKLNRSHIAFKVDPYPDQKMEIQVFHLTYKSIFIWPKIYRFIVLISAKKDEFSRNIRFSIRAPQNCLYRL